MTASGELAQAAALSSVQTSMLEVPDEASVAAAARGRTRKRRLWVNAVRLATLVVLVGGWQWFATIGVIDPFFFGSPTGVVTQLVDWAQNGTPFGSLWLQIGITMQEAVLGFIYGVLGGIVVGVLLGQVPFLADVASPYIKVLNAIPRIVLGSLFVVVLGLGTVSKVLLASVLVFFVVFFNAFQGVREVDRDLTANVRVLGASRWQVVRHVVVPSAVTWIIASLHTAFGFAVIGAIVGEFLGAQKGLGVLIFNAQNNFNPDGLFGAMLIIGAIALIAEALINVLERRLLSWRPPSLSTQAAGL